MTKSKLNSSNNTVNVKALSSVELRSRLGEFGESPGPIVESTRRLHELRLSRLMADGDGHRTDVGNSPSAGLLSHLCFSVY